MLGCCLIYSHFLWAILPIRPVELRKRALFTDFQGPAKKGPSEMPPKVGEDLWQVGWSAAIIAWEGQPAKQDVRACFNGGGQPPSFSSSSRTLYPSLCLSLSLSSFFLSGFGMKNGASLFCVRSVSVLSVRHPFSKG